MLVHFADMRADLFKALLADDVLNAAGVLCCNVLRHAEIGEPIGKQLVALIHAVGDGKAVLRQVNVAVAVYGDQIVLAQLFHAYADTGLCKIELVGNINRTHIGAALG